jgi:hypothetical protein
MPTSTPSGAETSPVESKSGVRALLDFAGVEMRSAGRRPVAKGVFQADIDRTALRPHAVTSVRAVLREGF